MGLGAWGSRVGASVSGFEGLGLIGLGVLGRVSLLRFRVPKL